MKKLGKVPPGIPTQGQRRFPHAAVRGLLREAGPAERYAEGNVWARQRRYGADDGMAGADMYESFIFGADGRHLGMIELPAGLEIYQIGVDFVLGKVRDALDVDYVHLYRIEK